MSCLPRLSLWRSRLPCAALLAAAALLAVAPPGAQAQDLLSDKAGDATMGKLLGDLAKEQGKTWWNKAWRFRRRVTVDDPALAASGETWVALAQPDPLLLYNTGRCLPGLADLRAVTEEGTELPCKAVNLGLDDGSGAIQVKLAGKQGAARVSLYLYYGNPGAAAADVRTPARPPREPFKVSVGEEEARGDPLADLPAGPDFFRSVVVVEAESSADEDGRPVVRRRGGAFSEKLVLVAFIRPEQADARDRAGAGAYMIPRVELFSAVRPALMAWTAAQVPRAGRWRVHVRYKASEYRPDTGEGKPALLREFVPFTLILGGREFVCGTNQQPGALFRWDTVEADLPAGELKVGFRMTGLSGPDCVLLTQDARYRPDHRDVNGPVWMRFRLRGWKGEPFFIDPFCVVDPWNRLAESAGYVFRDWVLPSKTDVKLLAKDKDQLLASEEWSPWVCAPHSTVPSWYAHILFYTGSCGRQFGVPPSRYAIKGGKIGYQFASRPDPSRVFAEGEEESGLDEAVAGLSVIMPTDLGLEEMLGKTATFTVWAEKRLAHVESLGLTPGNGPREIIATTMAQATTPRETACILKSCRLLGFNGVEVRSPLSGDAYAKAARDEGFAWTAAHHWHLKFDITTMPSRPGEGLTWTETLDRFLADEAKKCYAPDRPQWGHPDFRARLLIMGDEIGPATRAEYINLLPLLKGTFHEYLQRQGLTPEFFGKTNWADVEAFTYGKIREGSESWDTLVRIMAAQGLEPPKTMELPEEKLGLKNPARASAEEVDLSRLEEEKQAGERLGDAAGKASSLQERRLYHWTQRFRSWYTTRFYGLSHAELQRVAREELRLPWKPRACPNFQAMPIMCGQMWDGALNLFEWARSGTTDYLSVEDWINGPYRVAFGMRLLKAAGRKNGQEIGHLIVADRGHFQRFLMSLGAGSRGYLSYLYGPLRTIGPAWADSRETAAMWAKGLRWVGTCEKDLLASALRPAEAAILVANTSEINTAYRHTALYGSSRPLRDRYDIFAALMDAQVPVEIVGEEEIVEDDALSRYRALYVSDPHVDSRAQERIRAWVEKGGVLWASHAGLARQEYDESSPLFDEVFGLAARGETLSTPESLEPAERIVVATNDLIPAVAFKAAPCRPAWTLGSAEVLARYADGTPVLLRNRFGKGQAFLLGNAPYACTGDYGFEVNEPPDAAAAREVVAVAARVAGVRPHVRLSHARVLWSVMDGPDQAVLVLANCFVEDIPGLSVEVVLPRKPARAYSGRSDRVPFEWLGDRARVSLDLARGDGEILVFRFAD